MSTPNSEDFRHIAVEALIDAIVIHRSEWPPAGWCEAFDAAHSYIPAWACKEPSVAFVTHCRGADAASNHALAHSLRRWLRDHSCAELARRERDVREAYAERAEHPQDWAPYADYLETNGANTRITK